MSSVLIPLVPCSALSLQNTPLVSLVLSVPTVVIPAVLALITSILLVQSLSHLTQPSVLAFALPPQPTGAGSNDYDSNSSSPASLSPVMISPSVAVENIGPSSPSEDRKRFSHIILRQAKAISIEVKSLPTPVINPIFEIVDCPAATPTMVPLLPTLHEVMKHSWPKPYSLPPSSKKLENLYKMQPKRILYGTMTLELGGTVNITCEKTGYSATLEFKLKPFLGNNDNVNQIVGKIKLGKEVLATLEGHWDSEVIIRDKKTDVSEIFWNPTPEIRQCRLRRYTVKFEEQGDFESERLWQHVTRAINNKDQTEATHEKCILEEAQRKAAKERKAHDEEWVCRLFEPDPLTGEWNYRYADCIVFAVSVAKIKRSAKSKKGECGFSSPEPDNQDSSGSEAQLKHNTRIRKKTLDLGELQSAIESIRETQEDIRRDITALRTRMTTSAPPPDSNFFQFKHYVFILLMILLQLMINYLFK
ncbi:hypothetical protein JD844_028018 [Phrynosoma platyrhinos]|uniref:Oxysterol-binding protein n=1 Tax=Phrynosoma platyrhinos TaxID=52577 RepID=A0ABQ7SHI7_PHRPL|nr:hypothetical protein JD844_028018 [Phrynosoma platyrhinos]